MRTEVVISVDGTDYPAHSDELTGAQIKALADKPPGNLLYRVEGRNHRELVADGETVHLHEHEKFVTTPPVGGAS